MTLRRFILFGLLAVCALTWGISFAQTQRQHGPDDPANTVMLEQMTWTDVHAALQNGFDTVIIPTAGIEQNGPHLVLGKHAIVVRHTAQEIARKLGHTLVLPVIDYVPEGDVSPQPTGHMAFPGTISVPASVFEQVLEAAAKSMRAHGFKTILFIGDSGGNQASQAKVAQKLSALWQGENILVANVGDYYTANGQVAYLRGRGFSDAQIGSHAGIRDTSEVLYIQPSAVRTGSYSPPASWPTGARGVPSLARAGLGQTMIDLKINAAVRQIRALQAQR